MQCKLLSIRDADRVRLQEHSDLATHAKALGQKYMGIRTQNHVDEMFRDTAIHPDGDHPVPVSNFLNAQCEYRASQHVI